MVKKLKLSKIIAILACVLVCLFCVSGYSSHARDSFASKFIQTVYNQKNGIESNEVNCLYQSSSGYVWVGTDSGLYRTNGTGFSSINLWETDDRTDVYSINCIMQDSTGKMWIGTDNYGLFFIEDGNNYHFRDEYYNGVKTIYDFVEDSDGNIFVASSSGLFKVSISEDGRYILEMHSNKDIAMQKFADIEIDDDKIWGITENNIYIWSKDEVKKILDAEKYTSEDLTCIKKINGDMYVGTKGRDIIRLYGNYYFETINASLEGIKEFMYDSNGLVWVCSDNGIGYLDKSNNVIKCTGFEIDNYLSDMIQDYEGNYWISSTRMGLLLLSRSKFIDYNMYIGMPESMVNAVFCENGVKYIGTDDGLIIYENNKRTQNNLTEKLDGVNIRHITSDSKGNIWIGTHRRFGIVKVLPSGEIKEIGRINGLPDSAVNYILPLSNGSVAVATEAGVSIIDKNDKVVNSYGVNEGLIANSVYCLYENQNGEIFVGTDGYGIYVINPNVRERVQNYNIDNGLNSNVVTCFESGKNGLWIGTDNGICYYNETFRKISNVEYSNCIYDILCYEGNMWLIGSMGVLRTSEEELLDSNALSSRYLDVNDGLIKTVNSISNSCIDDEGKIYICCNEGICLLDTKSVPYNTTSPKIKVTSIDLDGVKYEFDNLSDGIVLRSNVSRMTIKFAVFSYANRGNIKVEYYLDGFDSEPILLKGDERMEAVYTNLDGGVYEFKISAYNGDGTACEEPVSFVIEKEKSLFENPIARLVFVVIVLGMFILLSFILLRVQKKLKNKNDALETLSKEHEEAVKTSSAKSDYLANMSNEIKIPINAIMVKADEALHVIDDENPGKEAVKGIYDSGEGIISKVDDIILLAKIEAGKITVHESLYSITTLMYSLSEYAIEKIGDKGIRFFVEISENITDNVIGDEEKIKSILMRLIENSVKNTKEGSITLSVDSFEYDSKHNIDELNIEFTISDTGIGIQPDRIDKIFEAYYVSDGNKSKSHERSAIGLAIAKGYADIINADIEVESVYGAGTTFTLSTTQSVKESVGKNQSIAKVDNMVSREIAEKLWLPEVYGLLVDDDEVSREVSTKVLSSFEMKLDVASSGINAIDMVMNNDYDVVFLDLSMPIMNGIEVMNEIRDLSETKYSILPIISMDVDAIENNTAQLISDGFTDSLVKPMDIRRVAAILKDCLPEAKIKEKLSDIIQYIDNSRFGEGLKRLKPQIEIERAIEKIGGSIDVYNNLINAYYKQNIMDINDLREKAESDLRGFKIKVHSIRTFSVNIGAYRFAKEASYMEAAINKRNRDYIKHNIDKFVDNLTKLLISIEEYIEYMEDYVGMNEEEHAMKNAIEYINDSKDAGDNKESINSNDSIKEDSKNKVGEPVVDEINTKDSQQGKETADTIDVALLKSIREKAKNNDFDGLIQDFNEINCFEYTGENKEFVNVLLEFIEAKNVEAIIDIVGTYIELSK